MNYRQPQMQNHPGMEISFEEWKEGHTRLLRITLIDSVAWMVTSHPLTELSPFKLSCEEFIAYAE